MVGEGHSGVGGLGGGKQVACGGEENWAKHQN